MTVKIATGIGNGRPVGIYAQHVLAPAVRVGPAVRWVRPASHQCTAKVVEVVARGGAVIVRVPSSLASSGPLPVDATERG